MCPPATSAGLVGWAFLFELIYESYSQRLIKGKGLEALMNACVFMLVCESFIYLPVVYIYIYISYRHVMSILCLCI